jgi:hypothetical protein
LFSAGAKICVSYLPSPPFFSVRPLGQTEKVVRVSDYRLAVAYWIIILLIFAYVGGFVFYHQVFRGSFC